MSDFLLDVILFLIQFILIIIFIFLMPKFLKWLDYIGKDSSPSDYNNLYNWASQMDGGVELIKRLLEDKNSDEVMTNLRLIYLTINENFSSIKDLKLIKEYLVNYRERKGMESLYKITGTFILGILAYGTQRFLTEGIDGINPITPENVLMIFVISLLFGLTLIFKQNQRKNRFNLVISLIDVSIDEKAARSQSTNDKSF